MAVPDAQSLLLPLLKFASDGKDHNTAEACNAMAEHFKLTPENLREKQPNSGNNKLKNHIGWAKLHLSKAILLNPIRGIFRITKRGETLLADKPESLRTKDLKKFPEFIASRTSGNKQEKPNKSFSGDEEATSTPIETYSVRNILTDGCFIAQEKLVKILDRLRTKKNLILQGPPGTGKTWLAKRLAFALMKQRDDSKVRAVQFHPNLSYEDFIRGWRPTGEGKLELVDGPFVKMIVAAEKDLGSMHVIVIEEINRGNPAQIFGEMLTLLEVDKRTKDQALELSYKRSDGERFFIPDNLYVIGTMNIADRSLALVDLALRRRFAFIDLEPTLGKPWRDWVQKQCGIDLDILVEIENRLTALNNDISADTGLGRQFRVGHSYVTPPLGIPISDAREWFRQVVDTEIGPLLDEYWFDAFEKSQKARKRLLGGF